MDGTTGLLTYDLEALPMAALRVERGHVVASNAAARALLVQSLDTPRPVAAVLGPGFDLECALPSQCRVLRDGEVATVEAAVGEPRGPDGARIVLLRALPADADADVRRRLERGIAFERLLTRSSAELMRSPDDDLDTAIVGVLGSVGRFFDVDRSYVFMIDDETGTQSNTHEWVGPGISEEAHNLQDAPLDLFPWLIAQMRADAVVRFDSVDDLPPEASSERAEFDRQGIQSILIVPLWAHGVLRGFAGFDSVRLKIEWGEAYVVGLRLLAQMLAGALDARAMARRLRRQAMHDAVTGLPNRLYLRERFDACARGLPEAARAAAMVAVIDVDDFKVVNDRFGHACGDALLRELGRRLEAATGPEGVVARVGGDEFVVVEPHGPADPEAFAIRLLQAARHPFDVPGGSHRAGVSIGLVRGLERGDDLDTLLDRADAAMYRAKAAGKNRWALAGTEDVVAAAHA